VTLLQHAGYMRAWTKGCSAIGELCGSVPTSYASGDLRWLRSVVADRLINLTSGSTQHSAWVCRLTAVSSSNWGWQAALLHLRWWDFLVATQATEPLFSIQTKFTLRAAESQYLVAFLCCSDKW
jgi:hypothetical protein